jgi:ribosomal protein L12E/L44/L45/RPP1/RPP2
MSKKLKIIIAVAVAVVVIAVGGASIILADNSTTTTTTTTTTVPSNNLFAKAATILGVSEQNMTDAFKKASTAIEQQKITQALAQAVTKGTISQAESDAITKWLAAKPAAADKATMNTWQSSQPKLANPDALRGILGFGGRMMGPMGADVNNTDLMTQAAAALSTASGKTITADALKAALTQAGSQMKADAIKQFLANGVKNGKLTQDEANSIQSWWDSRPSALDKVAPNGGFCMPGMGRGGMMPGFGGGMPGRGFKCGKTPPTPTTTKTAS